MDKVSLNKVQLQQLVRFIKSKGFTEPFVVVEILDHFACKVEELLSANAGMTLDDAINNAHSRFGVFGFQPLVKAYYTMLRKKYMALYRQVKKKVLTSALPVLILCLLGILFYKSCIYAAINNLYGMGINDAAFLLFTPALLELFLLKKNFYKKENVIADTIINFDKWIFWGPMLLCPSFSKNGFFITSLGIHLIAGVYSFMFVYFILRAYCIYKTMQLAKQDMDLMDNYYNTLSQSA